MTATDDRPRLEIGTELTISPPKARELRDVTIRVVRPVSDSSRTSASRSVLYRVLARLEAPPRRSGRAGDAARGTRVAVPSRGESECLGRLRVPRRRCGDGEVVHGTVHPSQIGAGVEGQGRLYSSDLQREQIRRAGALIERLGDLLHGVNRRAKTTCWFCLRHAMLSEAGGHSRCCGLASFRKIKLRLAAPSRPGEGSGVTSWDHTNRCRPINVDHGGKYPLKIDRFRRCWPYAGTWEVVLPRTAGNGRGLTMEVVVVAWILCGIISAVSASNNGGCTLSEFFIFLLLGPLGSARKSKHERHREMLEQFRAQRSKLASSSGNYASGRRV